LDTDRPEEIVSQVLDLRAHPGRAEAMRNAAREYAAAFTWDQAVKILLQKAELGRSNWLGGRHE
jgi:hypothetical protein